MSFSITITEYTQNVPKISVERNQSNTDYFVLIFDFLIICFVGINVFKVIINNDPIPLQINAFSLLLLLLLYTKKILFNLVLKYSAPNSWVGFSIWIYVILASYTKSK